VAEQPSSEQFGEWKQSLVTEYIQEQFQETKDQVIYEMSEGKYKDDPSGYMWAVGVIHGLNYFLNLEYEEEESDE